MDQQTKRVVQQIPLMTVNAGPRDKDKWIARLKEEYAALIAFVRNNKESGQDWFSISSNATGTHWSGRCSFVHLMLRYEFQLQFEIPVTYPVTAPEIELPELDGKTSKMYRGGKICLTDHFYPLWGRNVPRFGIAQALALGLGPWLAAEIPHLIESGVIRHKGKGCV